MNLYQPPLFEDAVHTWRLAPVVLVWRDPSDPHVSLLPLGGEASSTTAYITSYAIALLPIALILYGFRDLASDLSTPRLLIFGFVAAIVGLSTVLPSRPDALAEDPGLARLLSLFLANLFRLLAAASLGLVLARYVISPGVALLIAGIAAASDLFSVFAGPTRILLREDSPALDFLLLVFPTFGHPLGFGLGLSDFVFLALFTYLSRSLEPALPLDPGLLLHRRIPGDERRTLRSGTRFQPCLSYPWRSSWLTQDPSTIPSQNRATSQDPCAYITNVKFY